MEFDADAVRQMRERMLLRLLFRATGTMNATMTERIRASGFGDFKPSFTAMLAHIDTEGTRIGEIGERMGTSRQAASQMLSEIEERGYVERVPDPGDRRAIVARHTARGRKILQTAINVMLAIEDEYAEMLGPKGLNRLKDLLKQLVDRTDPSGSLRHK